MQRLVGDWVINWCWLTVIEDHGDGTCTVLRHDRTKSPLTFERGNVKEDSRRNIVGVIIWKCGKIETTTLTVDNPGHVFSFTDKDYPIEIGEVAR